jgi:hypothetical protein
MRRIALLLALTLLLSLSTRAGEWTDLNQSAEPITVQVLQSDGNGTTVHYSINRFLSGEVMISGKAYALLEKLRGESTIEEPGKPRLPRVNRSIIIPDNGVMEARILTSDYVEIPDIDIAPSKGHLTRDVNPESIPYTFGNVYSQDAFFPGKIAELGEPYIMRDFRGVVVQLNAFQYNPAKRILRIYTDVTIEVKRFAPDGKNVFVRQKALQKMDPQFAKIYRRHFINFNPLDYPVCYETGGLLVICYDAFMSDVQPLVDWKNQKGLPTTMVPVSQVGSTTTQILSYIQNYYNLNDLCYVLLVGDQAQVPSFTSGSDPVYSLLGGSGDWYPDIFVGRFSAENVAQVQTQVERTLNYEKFPNPNSNWYARGLGHADLDGPCNPEPTDAQHLTVIARKLLHWNYSMVDSVYMNWGTTSMIIRKLNNGCSIWNQAGHGSVTSIGPPNFTTSNVSSLVNDNMLPHVTTVACQPGNFQSYTCLAEVCMRAFNHTTGEPTGTIGCYMSKISQTWFPPYDMQDEGVNLLCAESMVTLGGYCFNGSGRMIDNFGSQGESEFRAWNLFGDPSLYVRSMRPYPLAVACDSSIQVGATSFAVAVTSPWGPQAEAMVCGMNEEIYATALTDSTGQAILTFNPAPTQTGTFTLTVTTSNSLPNIREIDILSDGSSSALPNGKNVAISPDEFGVVKIRPNPFNARTVASYELPVASHVTLKVYDTCQREVATLANGWREAGTHEVAFDGSDLPSGVYLYRLETSGSKAAGKLILLK